MNQEIVNRILEVQNAALNDPHYQTLLEEHELMKTRFNQVLPTLTQAQQEAVMDYLGIAFAMHLRLLELACKED